MAVGGGVLNITAAAWTAGFLWWHFGNKKRTQNVSEYMLVLALCLVTDCNNVEECYLMLKTYIMHCCVITVVIMLCLFVGSKASRSQVLNATHLLKQNANVRIDGIECCLINSADL